MNTQINFNSQFELIADDFIAMYSANDDILKTAARAAKRVICEDILHISDFNENEQQEFTTSIRYLIDYMNVFSVGSIYQSKIAIGNSECKDARLHKVDIEQLDRYLGERYAIVERNENCVYLIEQYNALTPVSDFEDMNATTNVFDLPYISTHQIVNNLFAYKIVPTVLNYGKKTGKILTWKQLTNNNMIDNHKLAIILKTIKKLAPKLYSVLGQLYSAYTFTIARVPLHLSFEKANYENGASYYYHRSSCWFGDGSYGQSGRAFLGHERAYALLVTKYDKEYAAQRAARVWYVPSEDGQNALFFNAYGLSVEVIQTIFKSLGIESEILTRRPSGLINVEDLYFNGDYLLVGQLDAIEPVYADVDVEEDILCDCAECGDAIREDDEYRSRYVYLYGYRGRLEEEEIVCEYCYDNHSETCNCCNEVFAESSIVHTDDGNQYCLECYDNLPQEEEEEEEEDTAGNSKD